MKKFLSMILLLTMTVTCLYGCGSSNEGEAKQESAEEVESLNIMVWDGSWSEEVFEDFEAETGIHVNVSFIDNTDTIISKLIEGNADYDLVDIESAYVKTFVDNELLTKLDTEKLDSRQYLIDSIAGAVGDENMEYTTPNMAPNYTCVVYNKETCPIEIKSFKDLADPALEGEVAMVNSTISLYGMALEACGYSADSCEESEMKEANDLLKDIKKNVKAFVGESAVSQLENGECSVAFCWDYSTLCNDSKENWDKFEVAELDSPNEYFTQYWGIPSSSTKTEAAQQLINFIMQPVELAKCYTEYGGIPVEKEEYLLEYLPEDYYENPAIKKAEELYDNSWKIAVNDEQISLMDTYYTELMGN